MQSDTAGVGTARYSLGATQYGGDRAMFGFGYASSLSAIVSTTNKVSNAGVVAADTSTVATAKSGTTGCSFN